MLTLKRIEYFDGFRIISLPKKKDKTHAHENNLEQRAKTNDKY